MDMRAHNCDCNLLEHGTWNMEYENCHMDHDRSVVETRPYMEFSVRNWKQGCYTCSIRNRNLCYDRSVSGTGSMDCEP